MTTNTGFKKLSTSLNIYYDFNQRVILLSDFNKLSIMTTLIIWKQSKQSGIVFDQTFALDSLCKNLGVKFDILMIVLGFVHLTKVVVSYCFFRFIVLSTMIFQRLGRRTKMDNFFHQIVILGLQTQPNHVRDP